MYKKYKFIVYESREGMKIHYNNETTFTIFSWPEKKNEFRQLNSSLFSN